MLNLRTGNGKISKSLADDEFNNCVIGADDSGVESDVSSSTSIKELGVEEKTVTCNINQSNKIERLDPKQFLLDPSYSLNERLVGISKAFKWLKQELTSMKKQDRQIMRDIINNRTKIAEYKQFLEEHEHDIENGESGAGLNDGTMEYEKVNENKVLSNNFPVDASSFRSNKRATWVI